MNERDDRLQKWAKVKSDLKQAQRQVLKSHGLNWDTLNELEQRVAHDDWTDRVETEFGTVIFNEEAYFARPVGDGLKLGTRVKPTLLTKEK